MYPIMKKSRLYVSFPLLTQRLENDNAELTEIEYSDDRNVINRDARIYYKCSCGKYGNRILRALMKLGAFCQDCANKNERTKIRTAHAKKIIEINTIEDYSTYERLPDGYWDIQQNITKFMDLLKNKMGYTTDDDWYNLTCDVLKQHKGGSLCSRFNDSPQHVLKVAYPELQLLPWLFKTRVGQNFWKEKSNRIWCFGWLMNKLNYTTQNDYYNLQQKSFVDNGVGSLVGWYQDSTLNLLKDLFPEFEWLPWKFTIVSKSFDWHDKNNIKLWLDWFAKEHKYICMEDWYKLTQDEIKKWDGAGLLYHYRGSPQLLLEDNFPDYKFDRSKFVVAGYSKVACRFLDMLSESIGVPIQHELAGGEYKLPENKRRSVDGWIPEYKEHKKIIIQYHGCIYHGCPSCYDGSKINFYGAKCSDLFKKTTDITNTLKSYGYVVIELWGCEQKSITDPKEWFESKLSSL
jgi:hypothetical protein